METRMNDGKLRQNVAEQPIAVKWQSHRGMVDKLETRCKNKCMLAGSLVVRQVSQIAALAEERSKLNSLKVKAAGALGAAVNAQAPGGPSARCHDAETQTVDVAEAVRQEVLHLTKQRQELLDATRGVTKHSANMVELLKKRNAVLLAREERALERVRSERLAKEARVGELEQRLAQLRS